MATNFVVIGLACAVAVWGLQRRRWNSVVRAAVVLVGLGSAIIAGYFLVAPSSLGSEDEWVGKSPAREILLFALMLGGMAARYFTRAIEVRREKIQAMRAGGQMGARPGIEFDAWEFSYPLFFSVVTFGALLGQIQSSAVTLSNAILGFETGFFWQTILAKKQGDKS